MRLGRVAVLCFAGLLVLFVAQAAHADEAVDAAAGDVPIEGLSDTEAAELRAHAEKFQFQAEVNRMMKLIINSLYKNKEIFLREVISNASDALDKIRFFSLTDHKALESNPDLKIEIKADKDKKLLVIHDTGVGMTKDELVKNLGTLAKSGTAEFLQAAEQGGDMNLIGQFGVGFYSVFLVADKVSVVSKNNNDDQYIWESTADSDFSIIKDPRGNTLGRGTQITLHLKEEASTYLQENQLKDLIKKYSEFINYPIYLWTSKTENVEVPDEDAEEEEEAKPADSEDEVVTEDDEPKKPKTKTIQQTKEQFERMNENKPIWTRSPSEVTEDEYNDFYKLFTKDTANPLAHTHFNAEGEVEFRSILYVPAKAPSGLFSGSEETLNFVKLYVRRVFITDEVLDLLPRWLKFLKGLVDSDDMPLNVSRETLQQHKLIKVIRKKIVRKAIELFKKLSEDEDKYKDFLAQYGTSLKLGIIDDAPNRKRLAELVRFPSSTSDGKIVSLPDYVKRMKKGQETIFYLAGATVAEIEASPFLERLKARGYEVLYLADPIDEYMVQALADFDGHRFQNVAKDGLKFGDENDDESDRLADYQTQFEPLTSWLARTLSTHIEKATISTRLTTSPCALVVSQFGLSGNMERIMKAQAYNTQNDPMAGYYANQKKILEINPKHPVIVELLSRVETGSTDDSTEELAQILYDTAALRSGFAVKDTVSFASRIERILRDNLNVDQAATVEVNEKPAPEREVEEEPEDDDDHDDEGHGHSHDHDEL